MYFIINFTTVFFLLFQIPSKVTATHVEAMHSAINTGGMPAVKAYLEKELNKWETVALNIGVIGISGSGKSSFINAIRGLTADDEGGAATGVTDGTKQPTPYSHPSNPLLKFWDLPGVGTAEFPKETYLNDTSFSQYYFFVIVTSNRFTENDLWLGRKINECGKKFFFVKTKIQLDISNDKHDHPSTHDPAKLLESIRRNIKHNIGDLYIAENVFILDNHHRGKFQFKELEQKLINDLPKLKRQELIMSMTEQSEFVIKSKVTELRSSIWKTAGLSAAVAALFGHGAIPINYAMIAIHVRKFTKQLGIYEKSLTKVDPVTYMDPSLLIDEAESINPVIDLYALHEISKDLPVYTIIDVVEMESKFVPIIGTGISATISFGTTYLTLDSRLTHMEQLALDIIKAATEQFAAEALRDDVCVHVFRCDHTCTA